jgi:hypothetical protein
MSTSRAIVVLGMHRSGTSALTRGLQALGIYLGNDFLDTKPDNPTGYWEDKGIVDINERVLAALGMKWEDVAMIGEGRWKEKEIAALHKEAVNYVKDAFLSQPLWGFKDPRTVRLLPFWRAVLSELGVDDAYIVAIRTPLSIATSLFERQGIDAATAHRLWLVYMTPYLHYIMNRPFVVTDYDLLMHDPRGQLTRIAHHLKISSGEIDSEMDRFADGFLDQGLRHSFHSRYDSDLNPGVSPFTRESYLWLYELATDQISLDARRFWSAWENIQRGVENLFKENRAECS